MISQKPNADDELIPVARLPTAEAPSELDATVPTEIGGRKGPDPTRYGDWEKNGRCIDF